jgi:hypothetical protein
MVDAELTGILSDDRFDDLTSWSTDELRSRRTVCERHEAAVSYARRVLQGRLDIVRAELERRELAGSEDASELLGRLPAVLAGDHVATDPAQVRATSVDLPPSAEALVAAIDEDLGETTLGGLPSRDTDEVAQLLAHLERHEVELSRIRRVLFDRIDGLRDELAARYKDGRADVADLLR